MWAGFGFKRLLVEVRRIANALDVIALHFAMEDGRMWSPNQRLKGGVNQAEEPELMHTNDEEMLVQQLKDIESFKSQGWGE